MPVARIPFRLFVAGSALCFAAAMTAGGSALASEQIEGRVTAGGEPVSGSIVTLWEAGPAEPRRVAESRAEADGRFVFSAAETRSDTSLYVVAKGGRTKGQDADNPAISLIAVLGSRPPAHVTVNAFTTIASVWTHNQFVAGSAIKGPPLSLRIAAGQCAELRHIATGGYGATIQDPLNSAQTPTMANFATLASILDGCVTRVVPDACTKLFAAYGSSDRHRACGHAGCSGSRRS